MEKKLDLILSELQHLNQRVGNIETELGAVKTDVGSVKIELGTVKTDVGSMKIELGTVKTDVGSMKTELSTVKTELNNVQSQLDENTRVTRAIYDKQEETDARLENLTIDVHKVHGNVTALQEQLTEIQGEVEFTYQKTSKNEMELFKIRRDYA